MIDVTTAMTGIILVLIAMPMFSFGVIFQKVGLMKSPNIVFDEGLKGIALAFKEIIKNKWWIIGSIMGLVAWFPYIISMAFVGFMVSVPINTIGIIFIVLAANRILKEKIKWYEFIAIFILMLSPIMIAFSGISNVSINLYEMVFPLILFTAITVLITLFFKYMAKKKRDTSVEGLYILITGAFLLALGSVFTNILSHAVGHANIPPTFFFWLEIGFAIFWFDYPHLWVFISWWGLVICNGVSFAFYQSAFQKARVAIAFPIFNAIGLLIPILAGLLIFGNTFENYVLFFLAVVLIFIGTSMLGRFQEKIETLDQKKGDSNDLNETSL